MRLLAALVLALSVALPIQAQQQGELAYLVADSVRVEGQTLTANGDVAVTQGGTVLTARTITYDRSSGRLDITGPIRIDDGANVTLLADAAELDADLRNGILRGARLVLDQKLQLAALQMNRVQGRYTQLFKVAATSCRICAGEGPPIWEIRARRVVHDQQERQLYFDNAQMRAFGVPIFYLPRMRMPDPTLERATGFLTPRFRQNSQLGFGIKLPYFIKLGDHADVTLTPFFATETTTLEWRYRQAFRTGRIAFDGALSSDTLERDELRGYIFGDGDFLFRDGYRLQFDIEATTDDAYLLDYDYSSKDRLDSALSVTRTDGDSHFATNLIHYQTLRDDETNATQPTIIADVLKDRLFFPDRIGGQGRLTLEAHSHYRYSDADVIGRDVTRINAEASWTRGFTLPAGLRGSVRGQVSADLFGVQQDSTSDDLPFTATTAAAADLRWPLRRVERGGALQLLEPMVQIAWSQGLEANLPNDESTRAEFDEGNLLALSRFPAPDRREDGMRAALGLTWHRFAPDGWSARLSAGRIYRADPADDFSRTSGLDGATSDWLLAGQIFTDSGLIGTGRVLFDNDLDFARSEARIGWSSETLRLGSSYVWLPADGAEGRSDGISELTLDAEYDFSRHWTAEFDWRYDVASERTARAGLGLIYENECINLTLSASRRFTSSGSVAPATEFDLLIGLRGFGGPAGGRDRTRSCRG